MYTPPKSNTTPLRRLISNVTNLVYELFYPALQTPPLKLHRDKLVAAHHRIDGRIPLGADQRTTTGLAGFERRWIFIRLVILTTIYLKLENTQQSSHLQLEKPMTMRLPLTEASFGFSAVVYVF